MIVKNAVIMDGSFNFQKADISVRDGRIDSIGADLEGDESLDLSGFLVVPGFVDIHIHGCAGADTCDGTRKSISTMAAHLVTNGVTSFCPTTMTVAMEEIETAIGTVQECMKNQPEGAAVCGVNMEGPYISPDKIGAQKKECIRKPAVTEFQQLCERYKGVVKLIDLAPEVAGAKEFIQYASKVCCVSFAHSTADYETAKKSFDWGITHATHLFNAMNGLKHRAPGAVGAVFDDERVRAELICDGFHIHPAVLRTAFRLLGEDRSVIISDSMRAAGLADGDYDLGGQTVHVQGGRALLADGTIAGSTTNLGQEVKNLVGFGVPVRQVIKSATINPAREIGADGMIGSIEVGKKADFTVLDPSFQIKMVLTAGKIAYRC